MAASPQQQWTLKVEFGGEVRRLRNWPEDGAKPSVEALHTSTGGLFDLSLAQQDALSLKYRDDDGDLCTLVEASLSDALSFASQRGVLRLMAAVRDPCSAPPTQLAEAPEPVPAPEADMFSNSAASSSGYFADLRCSTSEQLFEARRAAAEHLENARPRVAEGLAYFKQQVVDDFQCTAEDMRDAFGPHQEAHTWGRVSTVVGTTAGIVAAARLVPLRTSRLAAHSVAVVAGMSTPCTDADADQGRQSATDDIDASASSGLAHFKHQVKNDFQSTRREASTIFSCFLGQPESTPSEPQSVGSTDRSADESEPALAQEESQTQQPHQSLRTAVPLAVSTFVGGSVAACLLPVRAARFAIASLANADASQADAAASSSQESTSRPS